MRPDPKPDKRPKPRGSYDKCPECGDWKASHAALCRGCSTPISGQNHYAWKGEKALATTKRMRATRAEPTLKQCEICGNPAHDRFRRDGSLDNCDPENIGQACRRCKMEMDGRLADLAAQSKRANAAMVAKAAEARVTRTCPTCGETFTVKKSHSLKRKYCSRRCLPKQPKALRSAIRSARHVPGWSVKHKGEDRCRNCGTAQGLHLHHVIPRSRWKAGRADLRNGIPLCSLCHLGWHRREVDLPLSLLTADELGFVLSADIGQDTRYWLERNYVGGGAE